MSWVFLLISSGLEVTWAAGLKYAETPLEWVLTILCMAGSFAFIMLASRRMGAALAYVFFVTFGAVGTYVLDVAFFGKEPKWLAVAAIAVILFSVARLHRVK
ncbi:SMR family transporter [Pseudomonas sp. S 311-6]|nr:SMR family transporter [Pseudomonas sp. S 311-6]